MFKIRNTKPLINSSSTTSAAAAASTASWFMPRGKAEAVEATMATTTTTTTTTAATMAPASHRTKTIWRSRMSENHLLWIIVAVILFGYPTFGKCFSLFLFGREQGFASSFIMEEGVVSCISALQFPGVSCELTEYCCGRALWVVVVLMANAINCNTAQYQALV